MPTGPLNEDMHNPKTSVVVSVNSRKQFVILLKLSGIAILALLFVAIFLPKEIGIGFFSVNVSILGLMLIIKSCYIYAPSHHQKRVTLFFSNAAVSYQELTVQQKLYVNSVLMALFTTYVYLTGGSVLGAPLAVVVLIFVSFIALRDVLRWYRALSENILGKAAIAIGFATASNLAYALANQLVSQVVHVTPTNFLRTTLFIAVLMIPVLMTLAGGIAFAIGSAASSFIILLSMGTGLDKFREWLFAGTWPVQTMRFAFITRLFQLVFYLTIVSALSIQGNRHFTWYENKVLGWIPGLIYNLDMYGANECKLDNDFKIAPLGDAKFLIAQKTTSGVTFQPPAKCDDLAPPAAAVALKSPGN